MRADLPILQPDDAPGTACNIFPGGLSVEQVAVARQMRAVKEEGRRLKAELRVGRGPAGPLEQRIAELERRWRQLEMERDKAQKRKMIALGYSV